MRWGDPECCSAVYVGSETTVSAGPYFALLLRWGTPCAVVLCCVYVGSETTVSAGPLLSFVDDAGGGGVL